MQGTEREGGEHGRGFPRIWAVPDTGIISDGFIKYGNKVIFYFAIPVSIFNGIHRTDLSVVFDAPFLLFNVVWFVFFFLVIWVLGLMISGSEIAPPSEVA